MSRGGRRLSGAKNLTIVNEDTQLRMSATYTRKGRADRNNKTVRRRFDLVIKGLLISSTLLGSVVFTQPAKAATDYQTATVPKVKVETVAQERSVVEQHEALVMNLRMATRLLSTAIQKGEISADFYEGVTKRIINIEARMLADDGFEAVEKLMPVLSDTDVVLKTKVSGVSEEVLTKRAKSIEALTRLQDTLGVPVSERAADQMAKQGSVRIASAQVQTVTATPTASNVLVNGKKTDFQAYTINGNNYFKLRDVAYVLNGTEKSFSVGWDGQRNAISLETGKAYQSDGSEMKVSPNPSIEQGVLSTSTIYLDGKEVDLTAYTINGNNYFKLRDLADALDFGVTWDGSLNTIRIDSNQGYVAEGQAETPPVKEEVVKEEPKQEQQEKQDTQVVGGIRVKYGNHTYGSENQREYDKVMEIIGDALADFDNYQLHEAYVRYINGERSTGDFDRYTDEGRIQASLIAVDKKIGPIADRVGKEQLVELIKLAEIAGNLIQDKHNPLTGTPRSAYDLLVRGLTDCDPVAHVYSAVFDSKGYNTMIIAGGNHADFLVEVDGDWFIATSGGFMKYNAKAALKVPGVRLLASPTNGDMSSLR